MSVPTGLDDLLSELDVRPGSVLLVHAALRGSGLRDDELLRALRARVGPKGTLVVPTFTPENSTTSRTHRAAMAGLTPDQREERLRRMPPFDRAGTPAPTIGRFAECLRTWPGAVRSAHPQTSFAALGAQAEGLLRVHPLDCQLGERSPLARLHEAEADILLFRVGFEACTAFHLAEYRRPGPLPERRYSCVVDRPGGWVDFTGVALSDADFPEVGARLPDGLVRADTWAGRTVRMMPLRAVVDAAVPILAQIRR